MGSEKTILDVIKDKRLKWFGHVCRKPNDSWVYQSYKQDFPHPRPRGRPPRRWVDIIKRDTGLPILTTESNAQQRSRWRQNRLRSARGWHDLSKLSQVINIKTNIVLHIDLLSGKTGSFF